MGTDFEAVRQWLEENDAPKEVKEAFDASPLRTQLEEATKKAATLESELTKATSKLTKIEKAPVLKKSLEQLGVDYDAQPRFGKKALEAFEWEGDEPDLEQLASYLTEEGFEVAQTQAEAQEQTGAEKIVNQANLGAARFDKTPSLQEQIQQAEAAGDFTKSFTLKNRLLEQQRS